MRGVVLPAILILRDGDGVSRSGQHGPPKHGEAASGAVPAADR